MPRITRSKWPKLNENFFNNTNRTIFAFKVPPKPHLSLPANLFLSFRIGRETRRASFGQVQTSVDDSRERTSTVNHRSSDTRRRMEEDSGNHQWKVNPQSLFIVFRGQKNLEEISRLDWISKLKWISWRNLSMNERNNSISNAIVFENRSNLTRNIEKNWAETIFNWTTTSNNPQIVKMICRKNKTKSENSTGNVPNSKVNSRQRMESK